MDAENIFTHKKKKEVTGGWKEIHNKELKSFQSSPNISKIIVSGYVAQMVETGNAYSLEGGKVMLI
jgi:hypothetical protein